MEAAGHKRVVDNVSYDELPSTDQLFDRVIDRPEHLCLGLGRRHRDGGRLRGGLFVCDEQPERLHQEVEHQRCQSSNQ